MPKHHRGNSDGIQNLNRPLLGGHIKTGSSGSNGNGSNNTNGNN